MESARSVFSPVNETPSSFFIGEGYGLHQLADSVRCLVINLGDKGWIAVRRLRRFIGVPAFKISPADTICAPGSLPAAVVPAYPSKPNFPQCLTGAKACDALSAMRTVGTSGPNLVQLSHSARRNGIQRRPASILHSFRGQR